MPTYSANPDKIQTGTVVLTGEEAHHLTRVLRAQKGETLKLTDGEGKIYEGKIADISKKEVVVSDIRYLSELIPPYPIHLYLSLLKAEKMEFIVQKMVELNVEAVHFVPAARSIFKEIPKAKWERLVKIAAEAQKQCGRAKPIRLIPPDDRIDFGEEKMTHLICVENEKNPSLRETLAHYSPSPPFAIWIGPEGGWEAEEISIALDNGSLPVSLGPLVLRAETAVIHAVSSLSALSF